MKNQFFIVFVFFALLGFVGSSHLFAADGEEECIDANKDGECDDNGTNTNKDGESDQESDEGWDMTVLWRGSSWTWKTECDTSGTDNMTYGGIGSYVEPQQPSMRGTSGTLNFDIKTSLDHDPDNYNFANKTFWTVLAHNKKYVQSFEGKVEFTCSQSSSYYDSATKNCVYKKSIDVDTEGGIRSSFYEGKEVRILLRGYKMNFDANSSGSTDQENYKHMGVWISHGNYEFDTRHNGYPEFVDPATRYAHIGVEGSKITANFISNFGNNNKNSYDISIYYVVLVYNNYYVHVDSFNHDSYRGAGLDMVFNEPGSYSASENNYLIHFFGDMPNVGPTVGSDAVNGLIGLTGWAFYKSGSTEFHRITAYTELENITNIYSYGSGSTRVTVNTYGNIYREPCGLVSEEHNDPNAMVYSVVSCLDTTVCKLQTTTPDWESSSGTSMTQSKQVTISGLQ